MTLNGLEVEQDISKGYLHIRRTWQEGDTITLTLPDAGSPRVWQSAGASRRR
ncbi:glycosyl hydrolase [Salmonella enterica subsp. enterica]|nr:glycosyl hydrolase [Salmonella enterica subsp. enterica]